MKKNKVPKKIYLEVEKGKFTKRFYVGEKFSGEDVEYVLAGSERKAVVRRLEKWAKYKSNYIHTKKWLAELKKIKEVLK